MAGHSLGEYTALVAAGALAFADAVPLVRFRAQAMQDAVPAGVGAMAAIMGGDDDAVAAACAEAAKGRWSSRSTSMRPGQVVIAGHREAVERAIALAKQKGAKRGVLLPVSAPFHSSLLKPAADKLAARLAQVAVRDAVDSRSSTTSTWPNTRRRTPSAPRWRSRPRVRCAGPRPCGGWPSCGVTHVVECGPGRVLAGMTKRIADGIEPYALIDGDAISETLAALNAV